MHLIFDTWPEAIAKPLAEQVQQVLTIPRGGLLTVSVLAAAYFASNGVEALRISLNRAYRQAETRHWYVTRLWSLCYVVFAVVVFAAISAALVAVPVAMNFAEKHFPWATETLEVVSSWSLYGTVLVLFAGLLVSHLWMPAGRRGILDVLPGILFTLLAWTAGALIFAYYISTFANYTATYAGLASIMIVIVFLYMIGVIFILGAELNAALLKYRVRDRLHRRYFDGGREQGSAPAKTSQSDEAADIGR